MLSRMGFSHLLGDLEHLYKNAPDAQGERLHDEMFVFNNLGMTWYRCDKKKKSNSLTGPHEAH